MSIHTRPSHHIRFRRPQLRYQPLDSLPKNGTLLEISAWIRRYSVHRLRILGVRLAYSKDIKDLADIEHEAGKLANLIANMRLRCERAAGKLLQGLNQ